MSAVDTSWMPATGRHQVSIGASLGKALKARKGIAKTSASRVPIRERDFYSLKYNFKPPSVDMTRTGMMDVARAKESTNVSVELPTSQPGESQLFTGNEQPAREWECVLIYDEETGEFTLEKLESFVSLKHDRKVASTLENRRSSPESPAAASSAAPSPAVQQPKHPAAEESEEEGEIPLRQVVRAAASKKAVPLPFSSKGKKRDHNALVDHAAEAAPSSRATKRQRSPEGLALPPPASAKKSEPEPSPPPPAELPQLADASESEEEWDEVPAIPSAPPPTAVDQPLRAHSPLVEVEVDFGDQRRYSDEDSEADADGDEDEGEGFDDFEAQMEQMGQENEQLMEDETGTNAGGEHDVDGDVGQYDDYLDTSEEEEDDD